MFELVMCWGISWAGCAGFMRTRFETEASCHKALATMRVNDQPVAESEKRRSMWAVCIPTGSIQPNGPAK